jgi:hypothetical protein
VFLPHSSGTFLTLPLLQDFQLQGCWAGAATHVFSDWLVYLQFHEELPLPSFSVLRVTGPLCYVSFLVVVYFQYFF